jgi:hypothetical protein
VAFCDLGKAAIDHTPQNRSLTPVFTGDQGRSPEAVN